MLCPQPTHDLGNSPFSELGEKDFQCVFSVRKLAHTDDFQIITDSRQLTNSCIMSNKFESLNREVCDSCFWMDINYGII